MPSMLTILTCAAVVLGVQVVFNMLNRAHEEDENKRRAIIIYLARSLWPGVDLCQALDYLYALTLRDIKSEYALGNDTSEMQEDLIVIQNERNRLLMQEDCKAVELT